MFHRITFYSLVVTTGVIFGLTMGGWAGLGFDYLAIDDVQLAMESQRRGVFSASPELVVIGSDGGGQWLAYDKRKPHPWPLVMYCPGAPNHSNYIPVARSLEELLLKYMPK